MASKKTNQLEVNQGLLAALVIALTLLVAVQTFGIKIAVPFL